MTKFKGRNLLVFIKNSSGEYKAIAAGTSCELDESTDVQTVASKSDGVWTHVMAKKKSWKVTSQHLMTTDNTVQLSSLNGTDVYLKFATTSDSDEAREASSRTANTTFNKEGRALCTRSTVSAKNGDWVSGSFEFTGNGELTNNTVG